MRNHILPWLAILAACAPIVNQASAGDELAKAIRPVIAAESYQFSVKTNGQAQAVEVKYQKGLPLFAQADKIDFFRKGEILVYKDGEAWQRTRTGTLSDPLCILGASAKVRSVRLPHEELAIVGKALKKVERNERLIAGEFDADAAKTLARTEDRDLARGGTAKLWFDGDGRLAKYEIAIRVQGRRGNAEVDGVMTTTVSLTNVGATKVIVPDAAKKILE
jgi:hypothetical protein